MESAEKTMNKILLSLAAIAAIAVTAGSSQASGWGGGCSSCNSGPRLFGPRVKPSHTPLQGWFGNSGPKPQSAPWYQYWPYIPNFQTPGPVGGMGAPGMGGMVNPYFPHGGM